MPFSEPQMQAATNNKIAPARAFEPPSTASVDPSDWEAVRKAVAGVAADAPKAVAIAWHNARTGSDGVLTVGTTGKKTAGLCRPFTTTLNGTRGVRSYRGEACQGTGGAWKLANVVAEDAA